MHANQEVPQGKGSGISMQVRVLTRSAPQRGRACNACVRPLYMAAAAGVCTLYPTNADAAVSTALRCIGVARGERPERGGCADVCPPRRTGRAVPCRDDGVGHGRSLVGGLAILQHWLSFCQRTYAHKCCTKHLPPNTTCTYTHTQGQLLWPTFRAGHATAGCRRVACYALHCDAGTCPHILLCPHMLLISYAKSRFKRRCNKCRKSLCFHVTFLARPVAVYGDNVSARATDPGTAQHGTLPLLAGRVGGVVTYTVRV